MMITNRLISYKIGVYQYYIKFEHVSSELVKNVVELIGCTNFITVDYEKTTVNGSWKYKEKYSIFPSVYGPEDNQLEQYEIYNDKGYYVGTVFIEGGGIGIYYNVYMKMHEKVCKDKEVIELLKDSDRHILEAGPPV